MGSQRLHPFRVLQQIKSWDHISQVHNVILFRKPLKNFSTCEQLGSHFTDSQCNPIQYTVLQKIKSWDHILQVHIVILFMTLFESYQQVNSWVHISQVHNGIPNITPFQSFATNKELGSHFTGSQCDPIHDTIEKLFNM